jgi:hypothetical protein
MYTCYPFGAFRLSGTLSETLMCALDALSKHVIQVAGASKKAETVPCASRAALLQRFVRLQALLSDAGSALTRPRADGQLGCIGQGLPAAMHCSSCECCAQQKSCADNSITNTAHVNTQVEDHTATQQAINVRVECRPAYANRKWQCSAAYMAAWAALRSSSCLSFATWLSKPDDPLHIDALARTDLLISK